MNNLPESVLLLIFSKIGWRLRLKLESVSMKWNRILQDKRLRMIGSLNLNSLVSNVDRRSQLPEIIISLLVTKRKIITELTGDMNTNIYTVMRIMPEVFISQARYLTHLTLCIPYEPVLDNINALLNLKVLGLKYNGYKEQVSVDLSQLTQLTVLTGQHVKYVNCRSRWLASLYYSDVTFDNLDDCSDFIQMISESKQNIEVLELHSVRLKSEHQFSNLKLPKLSELKVCFSVLPGVIIDLEESTGLIVIRVDENGCRIINLDLSSTRSLICFDVDDRNIVDQFFTSAVPNAASLSLLQNLTVGSITSDQLALFGGCFSSIYNYSLRKFKVHSCDHGNVLYDSDALVNVLGHCPDLYLLDFEWINIEKDCLINLIIATVPLDITIDIKFREIIGGTSTDFITDLYTALSLINSSIIYRSDVSARLRLSSDWDATTSVLDEIDSKFGIGIFPLRAGFS